MEIYCERVRDLLNPKSTGNLRVRYIIIINIGYKVWGCRQRVTVVCACVCVCY